MAETCDYEHCENDAEYYDDTDNQVCGPCMDREIEDGANPDSFESIKSVQKALRDGEPCTHPGCLSHDSHPCEECGRVGGKAQPGNIDEIKELAKHDHTVRYCLDLMFNGAFGYTGILEMMVIALAQEKKILTDALIESQQREAPGIFQKEAERRG